MIDAAAIDRIVNLARESHTIVKAPDFDVDGTYLVRLADGSYETRGAERQPLQSTMLDTASFATIITTADALALKATAVAVFYSPDRITAVCAGALLRWRHDLPLPRHPAFARLQRMTTTDAFNQRQLIRMLRADLNGHVDDTIVEQFRTLKLRTDGEGTSVVAKGREAVDRRIQQQVTAAAGQEIPDEIHVTVPVYDLDEARDDLHAVTLLVDVRTGDDGQPVFELTTVLNTLKAAERAALDGLIASLKRVLPHDLPVYYGAPR